MTGAASSAWQRSPSSKVTAQARSGSVAAPATAARSSSRETNLHERPRSWSCARRPSVVTGKIARGAGAGSAET
jgi:hypothetical protein